MKCRIAPFYRLLSFIMLFAFFLMADSILDAVLVLVLIFISLKVCKVDARKAITPLFGLYVFYLTVFFFNALFQRGETVYWSWWIFNLTREGMITGAVVVARVLIVSILANILTMSMSALDLSNAMGSLLAPLKILHVPVDDAAFMISQAFSFIPRLTEDAEFVNKSMRARGGADSGRMKMSRMVLPLSIAAFRRADDMSMALISRGYDGGLVRRNKTVKPDIHDILSVAISLCVLLYGIFL